VLGSGTGLTVGIVIVPSTAVKSILWPIGSDRLVVGKSSKVTGNVPGVAPGVTSNRICANQALAQSIALDSTLTLHCSITSHKTKKLLLAVDQKGKCVGKNGWARARIVRGGSRSRAEFRGDEINCMGGVVEGHGSSTTLCLDRFHE
jgi:hypothetical protein